MKSSVAITIDDVLRKADGHPLPEGIRLYKTLADMYNLVLLSDDQEENEFLDEFLRVEALDAHSQISYRLDMYQGSPRVAQVQRLRNAGFALDFVIEPDPEKSARLMMAGFNVLHFMHRQYARPDWRPDYERADNSWDTLVRRELQQKLNRAADARVQ